MENLIKALQIFLKYGNPTYPTHCEHDVLYVVGISPDIVSDEDKAELEELGFLWKEPDAGAEDTFYSFRYGST